MKYRIIKIAVIAIACIAKTASAQTGAVSLGIEYKPIFPVSFLKTGTKTVTEAGVDYSVALNSGFSGGMVIRKSFTKLLSFETGISYVRRAYSLSVTEGSYSESADFNIIGYEIPVSLLIYIQTGEKNFMNVSMGVSPDMFASNVQTRGATTTSFTSRYHFIQPAVVANVGWEYRTDKAGYIYVGASFHSPFSSLFLTQIRYRINNFDRFANIDLSGSYLTANLRYFFPPDMSKKKKQESTETDY